MCLSEEEWMRDHARSMVHTHVSHAGSAYWKIPPVGRIFIRRRRASSRFYSIARKIRATDDPFPGPAGTSLVKGNNPLSPGVVLWDN
jgi:hypothetical protein